MVKKKWLPFVVALFAFVLAACGNNGSENNPSDDAAMSEMEPQQEEAAATPEEPHKFVVGASNDFNRQIWEDVGKRLEDKNIEIEVKEFSDFLQQDVALEEGAIDANTYQYTPFLYDTNTTQGFDLIPIGYAVITPLGIWAPESRPLDSLDDLKDGAVIGIGNDPVNINHELRFLQDLDLLKLTPDEGQLYTQDDIVENPKNLEIKEVATDSIVTFADDFDLFITGASVAGTAGYEPDAALVIEEPENVPDDYKLVFAVRREDKDDPIVNTVLDEYQSDATIEAMKRVTDGKYNPGWDVNNREEDNKKAFEHYEEYAKEQDAKKEENGNEEN